MHKSFKQKSANTHIRSRSSSPRRSRSPRSSRNPRGASSFRSPSSLRGSRNSRNSQSLHNSQDLRSPQSPRGKHGSYGSRTNDIAGHQSGVANTQPLITRRGFIAGALGVAATAAAGGIFAATQCSNANNVPPSGADDATSSQSAASPQAASGLNPTEDLKPISVANESVFTTEQCEYMENPNEALALVAQAHLPYGTMILPGDETCVACVLPCENSNPLAQIGVLSFDTGLMTTLLNAAVGAAEGYEIYDARVCSQGLVWMEANITRGLWRVYSATLGGIMTDSPFLGNAAIAAEGNSDWQMPELAASGTFAFMQMCPNANGPAKKENSLMTRVPFGGTAEDVQTLWESEGAMACSPSSTAMGVAFAPRADTKGTSYQLVHIDASSGQVIDTMLLPQSMRPSFVAWGDTGFSFAFDSIYNYGDGISGLGTYTPATTIASDPNDGAANDGSAANIPRGNTEGEWFCFSRTPFTEPAWCNRWFIVKSTSVVAGIDLAGKRYFTLSPETATQGYGEFLAATGGRGRFATYSNIDYTPLNGKRITECNVRIWQAA